MDVGKLDKRITFCIQEEQENDLGQQTLVLKPVRTVWATVKPIKGKEVQEINKLQPELTYQIYTRYFDFVTEDMLIKFRGKILEIVSPPVDSEENHEFLFLLCTEYKKRGEAVGP